MKDLLDRAIDRLVTLTNENLTLKATNSSLATSNLSLSTELDAYKSRETSTESSISKLNALLDDAEPTPVEPEIEHSTTSEVAEPISPIEAIEATFPTVDPAPTPDPALVPVQIDVPVNL